MMEQDCRVVWEFLLNMLTQLGFEINRRPHKCIAPCRELTWLGMQLNVSNMTVALPQEKVTNCLLYTSPSPRDQRGSRMPSSA